LSEHVASLTVVANALAQTGYLSGQEVLDLI